MSTVRVFLVDDSRDILDSLGEYLTLNDMEVSCFDSARGVLDAFNSDPPDLIILDIMLPDGDGFSLAKMIRAGYKTPIIFLTARISELDRITGFELGADDYVVKPFSMKELLLRIQALLRRLGIPRENVSREWSLDKEHLLLDEVSHQLRANGAIVKLTVTEWRIFSFLVDNRGGVFSRKDILDACMEYSFNGYVRIVDTHLKNMRFKLGNPGWIETVRGVGYRFVGEEVNSEE